MSPRGRPSKKQRESVAAPKEIAEVLRVAVDASQRLDKALALRLPGMSRARIQQLIASGLVLRGGAPLRAADRVEGEVEIHLPETAPSRLEPAAMALPVLYEDPHIVVIDKPAGIAVHPGAGAMRATIVHGLLHQVRDLAGIGGELRPGIVHRLDRDTSGCLAVAKTEPALRGLQAAFKERRVDKRYRALVHGAPPEQGAFDTPFGRHPTDRKRFTSKAGERRAVTRWRVLARAHGASWLEVELFTGRTHQIRAHFADHGWPLVGDKMYGGTRRESKLPAESPLRRAAEAVGRQALHAAALAFDHPITGARVSCEAPLPEEMRAALAVLGISSA